MKLLIATPLYPPEPGGPATYAKILEEHFPLAARADLTADEVVLVKWSDTSGPKGVRHFHYFMNVLHAARSADIILALDPVSVGFPTALAALLAKKPLVVKIVGDFAWEQGQQRFGITESLDQFIRRSYVPIPVMFLRALQTFVAHTARKVIVPSEYLKKVILSWGIPEEKITVIYNSIELPQFTKTDESGVGGDARATIVSVGRLVPWKGMDGVIEAVAVVRKGTSGSAESVVPKETAESDVTLAIIGDGPEKERLTKKGAQLLGGAVQFPGARSHEETLAAMRDARMVVLNSTYEGLSHVLIEALALGCAIIASDAGGNGELIQNEVNGLLVPSGDTAALTAALSRMLRDATLREHLSVAAKESSKRFSVETMMQATRTLLASGI